VIKPNKEDKDKKALRDFILKIVEHFNDRASQREHTAIKVQEIHKASKNDTDILKEPFPEYINDERLIPDETFVIVGYYNDKKQYDWIKSAKKYNFRMGSGNGSLVLEEPVVKAKYLLLHTGKQDYSDELWQITSKGPKVYSRKNLEKKGYPKATSKKEENRNYLVFDIKKVDIAEFGNSKFLFKQLKNYKPNRQSAKPITTTISELLRNKTLL